MNALYSASLALFIMMCAACVGMLVSRRIPALATDTPSIKSMGTPIKLIATMTSLILGLMVNSSRYYYISAEKDLQMYSTTLMRSTLELAHYGPQGCEVRGSLEEFTRLLIWETWPPAPDSPTPKVIRPAIDQLISYHGALKNLVPVTDKQNDTRDALLSLSNQLLEYRWHISNFASSRTPQFFIVIVICWLALIFGSLAIFAPRNPLVISGFLLTMVGTAAAIFLVVELANPFSGPLRVARTPLLDALHFMDAHPCPEPAVANPGAKLSDPPKAASPKAGVVQDMRQDMMKDASSSPAIPHGTQKRQSRPAEDAEESGL